MNLWVASRLGSPSTASTSNVVNVNYLIKIMFNFSTKEQRKTEEYLYSLVTEEIERNEIQKSLWTKALADSDNDKQKTQALYIKYRVQKLKDEISDREEIERAQAQREAQAHTKIQKEGRNLATLSTTVENTISTFYWLILVMIILSMAIWFFAYILYSSGDSYELWALIGGVFIILGFYLYYLTSKVKKTTDYLEIKKRLNVLFWILIPFSLLSSVLGAVAPILGLGMFIAFVGLSIRAVKFYSAFSYAKRNNLI